MKIINKLGLLIVAFLVLMGVFSGYQISQALGGQGTATIDGGANVNIAQATSHKFTVVLSISTAGITADAQNPTFTIPAGFTTPNATPVASAELVTTDGQWSVSSAGGSCTIDSSGVLLTAAVNQIITVDVTGTCTVAIPDTITLTYQGQSASTMGATPLNIGTAVDNGAGPVTYISAPPTITVASAANITIQSALVYSSNTIRVNFNNPGNDITAVDFLKWHIDANAVYDVDGGGLTPLNPISATLISAGTPWTIELTFSGTPFLYPTTYYPAINGLYVDAGGVTAGVNTNAVVLHSDSIFITSKYLTIQSATIISSKIVKVELNYSQAMLDTVDVLKWHIDVNGGGVTPLNPTSAEITFFGGPLTIELTFPDDSFSETSKSYSAATGLYVDAGGVTTVLDNSPTGDSTVHTNSAVPDSSSIAIDDGQKPIIISAATGDINGVGLDKVTITFSEDMIGSNGTGFSITGTDGVGKTIDSLGFPDGYLNKITFTLSSVFSIDDPDATVTYDGTGTFVDAAALHNPLTTMASPNITDRIRPTYTAVVTSPTSITLTFSENVTTLGGDTDGDGWAISGTNANEVSVTGNTNPGGSSNTMILTLSGPLSGGTHPVVNVDYTQASGTTVDVNSNQVANNSSVAASESIPPTVTNVTSTLADGTYTTGQVVPIDVTFSEPVIVTTNPQLNLATGNPETTLVDYSSGSSTNTLTFNYTVAVGNNSVDLDYFAYYSVYFVVSGSTIKDADGNQANANLATPGTTGSLGFNKAIVIDTEAPSTPIATPIAGTYTSTQNVALSSEGSTSIMYSTTDDYDPSGDICSIAPKYSGPIPVTSSMTIRAVGCDDAGNKSPMGTFVYTINIPSSSHSSGGYLPGYGPRANIIPIISVAPVVNPTITSSFSDSILGSGKCSQELIITDNMKKGNRNGVYSEYNKGIVKQIAILQAYINRILAGAYKEAAGPIDGIYGKLTKQGVERLQVALNNLHQSDKLLDIDGIIGVFTKEAINNSCGNN